MSALFGLEPNSGMRRAAVVLPEQPLYVPYELRTEMNWVDFSSTVNPLGTPKSFTQAIHASIVDGELEYSPDRDAQAFRDVLSKYFDLSPDSFLCGTTISAMIQAVAQAFQPCTVGISVPSPVEYSLSLANAGHKLVELASPHSFIVPTAHAAQQENGGFEAVVLANPSYPTGRLLSRNTLIDYLETCTWVIVDEGLIELTLGGASMIELTQRYRNLIVVRSLSSTFAMPGIPISYSVAHTDTTQQIQHFFDNSGISMFAEILAPLILDELDYLEKTRDLLESEIPWMQCMLNLIPGIQIFPAESNFVMCSFERKEGMDLAISSTDELLLRLQLAGYLIKTLEGVPGIASNKHFCVAVRTREENKKLLDAIQNIILK